MAMIRTDPDAIAKRLTDSMHEELEQAIRKKMKEHADAIVAEVARDLARSLKSYIRSYSDPIGGLQVTLVINEKKESI